MADRFPDDVPAAEQYRMMAQRSFAGTSPSYQAIAFAIADDPAWCARLDALPSAKRQPNLLLAAVRLLGGPIDGPAAFLDWTTANWPAVEAVIRERRTQTNEARRCATLLPVLAALPGPLALIEAGASAGLCLLPDRYAYRYTSADGEVSLGTSTLTLDCAVTGPAPLPTAVPEVVWRRGLDLHPLDVSDDEDARWLQALVWPEQVDRFEVLSGALAIARQHPPPITQGDLLTALEPAVSAAPADATLVVYGSAVLAYLAADDRRRFAETVHALGRDLVWISNEAPGVVVDADDSAHPGQFALAVDGRQIAWTGPHGHTLDWL